MMLILVMQEITVGLQWILDFPAVALVDRFSYFTLNYTLAFYSELRNCTTLNRCLAIVSTDIIRRIMKHYFKFKVKYVMNITDGR